VVAGKLRWVSWRQGVRGDEARCGLDVTRKCFQRAFDAGWFGLGPATVEPGSTWSFSGDLPVELTLVLDSVLAAAIGELAPEARLTVLAEGPAGQGPGPDLRAAAWTYSTVLQGQAPGVRAGFDRRGY
jgi:hypothetical protein